MNAAAVVVPSECEVEEPLEQHHTWEFVKDWEQTLYGRRDSSYWRCILCDAEADRPYEDAICEAPVSSARPCVPRDDDDASAEEGRCRMLGIDP